MITTFVDVILNMFFMSLFFGISSFFLVPSYERKGGMHFLLDRFKRLGIPFMLFYFLLNPSMEYMVLCFKGQATVSYFDFMLKSGVQHLELGPHWFLFILLVFSAAYVATRYLFKPAEFPKNSGGSSFPSNKEIIGFIAVLIVISTFVSIVLPGTSGIGYKLFDGHPTEEIPRYIAFFILGTLAWRRDWFETMRSKTANLWGLIALIAIIYEGVLIFTSGHIDPASNFESYSHIVVQCIVCVGLSLFLIGFFRDHLNHSGVLCSNLSRSAYTAYLIHPFFVFSFTALLVKIPVGPILHFLMLAVLAISTTFVTAHFVRQLPGLRRIL